MLLNPEQARQWRKDYIKRVTELPTAEPLTLVADDMHRYAIDCVADRSAPEKARVELAQFFKRR